MSKNLLQEITYQLEAAEKFGNLACAFSIDETKHIRDLIHAACVMRNTAIVDDDFPEVRDKFDLLLARAVRE